ncbi:MAG: Rieske 2Fe-2S domain-containing protein [Pseudomonadota bacterium]
MIIDAIACDDLPINSSTVIETDWVSILLANADGTFYAIENKCTHQDAPLAQGRIRRGFISCPLHGVLFDLKTGEPRGQLTRKPVNTFPVHTDAGRVKIDISSASNQDE